MIFLTFGLMRSALIVFVFAFGNHKNIFWVLMMARYDQRPHLKKCSYMMLLSLELCCVYVCDGGSCSQRTMVANSCVRVTIYSYIACPPPCEIYHKRYIVFLFFLN